MEPIIEIKNISKKYLINHQEGGYVALRDVMMNIIKSPFRFIKNKALTAVGMAPSNEDFWALKDVSANIYKGEIVGLIGANGAGKSTLLKLLAKITPPTEGEIIIRGSVGSLIEVGTGFHPELTGRENVFMNGSILGMSHREIISKFDSIVEFAGVQQFLDTPVKRYSSGMYVRLAFAIAIHMDPDILIVDEILAVGDAEFQKKCLGKIAEVARSGRTVIFVSHTMATVSSLCKKAILLEKGKVRMIGDTAEVIHRYTSKYEHGGATWKGSAGDDQIEITHTYAKPLEKDGHFFTSAPVEIGIEGVIKKPLKNAVIGFVLFSEFGYQLAHSLYDDKLPAPAPELPVGPFKKMFIIPANTLANGYYHVEIDVGIHNVRRTIGKDDGKLFFAMENDSHSLNRRFPDTKGQGYSSLFWPDWSS